MLILYDFECANCGKREERLVKSDIRKGSCPRCNGIVHRIISPVRSKLEGHTGHFPTAADKWARQHEKAGKQPSETYPDGWK